MMEESKQRTRCKQSSRRATAWRLAGGKEGQQERSRVKQHQKIIEQDHSKSTAVLFYNDVLANNQELLATCRERTAFDETLVNWKRANSIRNLTPSNVLNFLRDEGIIYQHKASNCNSTRIIWTVDVDNMVMAFYDSVLRGNPRQRRSCANRRVLNDTINQWKIDQRFEESEMIPGVSISPSVFVSTLMKLGKIINTREVSTRDEIIWADVIEDISPLTQEERSKIVYFDQKQMRANRAALTFYNQMLKDNRVLRRACAYRNIFEDVIDQWKKRPSNAGDPPKDGVASAAIIYGLIKKWGLIDHVNNEQGIVAWKEDVKYYNDGVIRWKDKWPEKDNDGNRQWLSEDEFKKRGEQMKNEYAAIVALSFYNFNSMIRDNPQLRNACTYRYFLNETIDSWKIDIAGVGHPPRNAAKSNIIHQLHVTWGVIVSYDQDTVIWKPVAQEDVEPLSFDDMLSLDM
jgi:hypothetical protein